jgi:hypothetical protein
LLFCTLKNQLLIKTVFFSRTEANTSTSNYAIPLDPPFSDLDTDPLHDSRNGIEHGPFLPSTTTELNNLFSDTVDTPDDSIIGNYWI